MLLCCVSVFMKCFSNKASVLHRVRTLIKCRTCAVRQLAAEAYLNAFSDTIVLRLIFSPWVFFFNSTCTIFLWCVRLSIYLYPLKWMRGTAFIIDSWGFGATSFMVLAFFPIHKSPCSEPSMVAFALSVIWRERQSRLTLKLVWAVVVIRTFHLLYSLW